MLWSWTAPERPKRDKDTKRYVKREENANEQEWENQNGVVNESDTERDREIRSGGTRGSEYAGSDVKCFIMTEWLLQQSSGAAVSQQLPLE